MGTLFGIAFLAASRVAIITVGPDPAAAGELQHQLETATGSDLRSDAVAAALSAPEEVLPGDAAVRAQIKGLLEEATEAFYGEEPNRLLKALEAAESKPCRVSERVDIALWRAAFFLSSTDSVKGARVHAENALSLAPDLKVDLKTYPPAVRDLVEVVRKEMVSFKVTVTGLPAGAQIEVDDRAVQNGFKVPAGPHTVSARAKGFRRVSKTFDVVATDVSVEMYAPLQIDPAIAERLSLAAMRGDEPGGISEIHRSLDVDVLVIGAMRAAPGAGIRAVVCWRADGRFTASSQRDADDAGRKDLAAWVASEIAAGLPSKRLSYWRYEASGSLGPVVRTVTVAGSGSGYDATFAGAGTRVRVDAARGSWAGAFELGLDDYSLSHAAAKFPDGTSATVNGGSSIGARIGARFERQLGTPGEGRWKAAIVELGLVGERNQSQDPSDLGLLPVSRWVAVEMRGGMRVGGVHLGRGTLVADAVMGLVPATASFWSVPSYTFGDPVVALGMSVDVGAAWQGAGPWRVLGRYRMDARRVQYKGVAVAPIDPPVSNAAFTETQQHFTLGLGRAF